VTVPPPPRSTLFPYTTLFRSIGSQITQIEPYLDALERLLNLIDTLAGLDIRLAHLDIGGGLGIRYQDETPIAPALLLDKVFARLDRKSTRLNSSHVKISYAVF